MSLYIAGILSKEFTCIPKILSTYFGRFYSNALCNGCTWLFILWYVLHSGLDYALNELFRKMRFKEYNRIRLKHALWYLGFYFTAFIYTGATLFHNRIDILGFKRTNSPLYSELNSELVLGFMVLLTFFIHSSFWEVVQYNSKSTSFSFVLLCFILIISFFLRMIEVAFTLIGFMSVTQVCIESTKLLFVVTKHDSSFTKLVVLLFFGISIVSFVLSYLIGVPLVFLLPFGRKIIVSHLPASYVLLTFTLACWYISEINNSPLFKLIGHWLFHTEKSNECSGNLVECSLFPPRNDVAFNILQLKKEIKEREERMLALRKQGKKGMLMQTLKCMINFRRKINARRSSREVSPEKFETSDSSVSQEEKEETSKLIQPIDHLDKDAQQVVTDQLRSLIEDVVDDRKKEIEDKTTDGKNEESRVSQYNNEELDNVNGLKESKVVEEKMVEKKTETNEKDLENTERLEKSNFLGEKPIEESIELNNFKSEEKTDHSED